MPSISDIMQKREKKHFKKVPYRPWDIEGTEIPNIDAPTEHTESPAVVASIEAAADNIIIAIDPNHIVNWGLSDRPEAELGDIEALAIDLKNVGQQQPCVVRIHPTLQGRYELIIGERRWRAASRAGIKLKAIVKTLSDHDAAIAQAAENDNRVDLSDYAKGTSFSKLINNGILQQKDLIEKLGRSKQYISALLSYEKIPTAVKEAIHDFSKVNAYAAEKIKQLSAKGEEYIGALVALAPRIREGKLGSNKSLDLAVQVHLAKKDLSIHENRKVFTKDGRHIFTWRMDNNNLPSIHFPKQINNLFHENKINLEEFTDEIINLLETNLNKLK